MGKRITRKNFILKVSAGLAGLHLAPIVNKITPEKPKDLYLLGKSDILVSRLCFEASLSDNGKLLEYAIDKGINFIDTARTYGNGNNEKIIGNIIAGIRKDIVISTKIRLGYEEIKSLSGSRQECSKISDILYSKSDKSMTALKTDYLDVLLLHDAIEENLLFNESVMKVFSDMKRSGMIRACGFSANESYISLTERNNKEGFYDVIMIPFKREGFTNINREKEAAKVLSAASEKGTGIIAMKVTGRSASTVKDENASLNNVKWSLDHDFIDSAVIVTDNFEILDEYISLL